jgi:hypothetical protein
MNVRMSLCVPVDKSIVAPGKQAWNKGGRARSTCYHSFMTVLQLQFYRLETKKESDCSSNKCTRMTFFSNLW